MAYNSSTQSTMGQSPFFLMFGRRARIPVHLLCGTGDAEKDMSVSSFGSTLNKVGFWRQPIIRSKIEWDIAN